MNEKIMLILPGVYAGPGKFPDMSGAKPEPEWRNGALHREAAEQFARDRGYEPSVIEARADGQDQYKKALDKLTKQNICAIYGFSGGGYNLFNILNHLASTSQGIEVLQRIELVVVIGAPRKTENVFRSEFFNQFSKAKTKRFDPRLDWVLVYRTDPPAEIVRKIPYVPKEMEMDLNHRHMFGPDALALGLWSPASMGVMGDFVIPAGRSSA